MGTIIAQGHDLATPATTSVMSSLLAGLQSCSLEEASPAAAPPPPLQQAASAISALGELPDEVLLVVASHLGVAALGALAQVDRRLRAIAEDDALWREMFGARFCFRPKNAPSSWKLAYRDYEATPRWHPTEKHPQLIATDDGLTVTMPSALDLGDNSAEGTDNRTIRATVEYKPGSGLHYFEVESRCPNEVRYHPYVGLCSTNEAVPVNKMLMWLSDLCYAYGGNGTLYSSPSLEGNHKHLGKYEYGDKIGVMVDYREEGHGWLTFFLNSKAVSSRMRITGTWFPCVGVFHPRHALQIVVRPQVPKPPCEEEEEEEELATA